MKTRIIPLASAQLRTPLMLSFLLTFALYATLRAWQPYWEIDGNTLLGRTFSDGFYQSLVAAFVFGVVYAALQWIGLQFDQHCLNNPPFTPRGMMALGRFVSGRHSDHGPHQWQCSESSVRVSEKQRQFWEQQLNHDLVPLQFIIWLLPLLGFIGTVVGITEAIGGLGATVGSQASGNAAGLENVLRGLKFAFETTFLGLIFVIPMMILLLFLRTEAQKVITLVQVHETPTAAAFPEVEPCPTAPTN